MDQAGRLGSAPSGTGWGVDHFALHQPCCHNLACHNGSYRAAAAQALHTCCSILNEKDVVASQSIGTQPGVTFKCCSDSRSSVEAAEDAMHPVDAGSQIRSSCLSRQRPGYQVPAPGRSVAQSEAHLGDQPKTVMVQEYEYGGKNVLREA